MGKKFRNKDLAARLGVSGTLVSLVLNNKADQHGIRKDTQEKVLALARQMGYFDQMEEKQEIAPVDQKPGIIGMVVPSMSDPFVVQIAPLLQKALYSIGVGFSVITSDPDDQRYERLAGAFRKFFSGLILLGSAADENTMRMLRNYDYPFVLLEKQIKTLRHNTVCTDLTAGSRLIAEHIAKASYRNVVILSEKKHGRNNSSAVHILADTLVSVAGTNRPVVIETDLTAGEAEPEYNKFSQFLRPPYRADVFVLMQASLVHPFMAFMQAKKIRIPGDLAVISMEDGDGFDLLSTPVTALQRPLNSMASKIANMIWSEVRNGGKGKYKRQLCLSPELIVRTSC